MVDVYYFDAPANNNVDKSFGDASDAFLIASKPGSGVSRAERDTLFQQFINMVRQTTRDTLACASDNDAIVRRSQMMRTNAGPKSTFKVKI